VKKILKTIGMILLILVALIAGFLFLASSAPSAPKDYTRTTETGGAIEAGYMKTGTYEVKHFTAEADEVLKKHLVYYPAELVSSDRKYPVIFSLNGTGVAGSKYASVFEHFASWGFIVLGNEDPLTGFGTTADKMYDFLTAQNADRSSPLYNKVDFDNIGLMGHSQGGAGVFSALSIVQTSGKYKTGVALSPTHEETAHALTWMYDLEKVSVPVLMVAGTETEFETQMVIPIEQMKAMFEKMPSETKVMARRKGADHGKMLYAANGYANAWFMWQLQGDVEASKAFTGDAPELLTNPLYQDQRIDLG
jgi:hypothetical protein